MVGSEARAMGMGVALALTATIILTGPAAAKASGPTLTADLDGVPIKVADVSKWYCHDFDYPAIHCFANPNDMAVGADYQAAVAATDYVTVYEFSSFAGTFMHMSQDYTSLLTLGWNDKISSLKGRNSAPSHFYTDWFYGGTGYSVCCNALDSTLGSFDNQFSSVHRN